MPSKTIIVTGASSGIGLALTRAFSNEATTWSPTRDASRPPARWRLPRRCRSSTQHRAARRGGPRHRRHRAVRRARPARQQRRGLHSQALHGLHAGRLRRLGGHEFTGFLHVTQAAVRRMRAQRAGHVAPITTSLADQPVAGAGGLADSHQGRPDQGVTKALAIEHAVEGIRFVAPGIIDTPMHKPEAHGFCSLQLHPIARLGTPEEIVEAVLYLDGATFVSGEVLHVDGGAHAGRW